MPRPRTAGTTSGPSFERMTVRLVGAFLMSLIGLVFATPALADELPNPRPQATSIDGRLLKNYAVLAKPRLARDELPASVRTQNSFAPDQLFGLNFDLSRRVLGPYKRNAAMQGAWLVPGNDALCLFMVFTTSGNAVTLCASSVEGAIKKGVPGTTGGTAKLKGLLTRVYGFAPDQVKSVTVRRRTGSRVRVSTRSNFFLKDMTRPNRAFLTIDGKRKSQRLFAPCDRGTGVC